VPASTRFPSDLSGIKPQEWRIAQLAASGLTNKQIGEQMHVSHRTVGSALYQLFPKLGVASRAGLRNALQALDGRGGADDT
jgi:DNA-binding NarL/FixJ family response regulator